MFDGEASASKGRWGGCFWAECGPLSPTLRCLMAERRLHTGEFGCLRATRAPKTAERDGLRENDAGLKGKFAWRRFDLRSHWAEMRGARVPLGAPEPDKQNRNLEDAPIVIIGPLPHQRQPGLAT